METTWELTHNLPDMAFALHVDFGVLTFSGGKNGGLVAQRDSEHTQISRL